MAALSRAGMELSGSCLCHWSINSVTLSINPNVNQRQPHSLSVFGDNTSNTVFNAVLSVKPIVTVGSHSKLMLTSSKILK